MTVQLVDNVLIVVDLEAAMLMGDVVQHEAADVAQPVGVEERG
jgi:hypothetical protein